MTNPLARFIGLRYVRSRQEEGFFSLVSLFSFAAMTLGVMALIVVLSVMNGFDREIKTRLLNVVPHVSIGFRQPEEAVVSRWETRADQLRRHPDVRSVAPYVEGEGMLSVAGELQGISLQGIDPAAGGIAELLRGHMLGGSLDALEEGEYGVVLGSLLARSLRVTRGDDVLLTLPLMTPTPVGIFPRVKRLQVVGIFQVGAQVDQGVALVHIGDARTLFRLGAGHSGLRLTLEDPFALESTVAAAREAFPDAEARVETWQESMGALFAAIRMEKTVVGLLLAIIIAVAGFNIVASLVLMVANKRKDIAVLRAMGATSSTVTGIFRVQGAATGIAGVALGVLLGCLVAWQLGEIVQLVEQWIGITIFDPEVYFISQMPSRLYWRDVVVIATLGILISLVATLYPAYRAGRVSPAEALRYDH